MSRHEADREDLFAEGTALTTRIELVLPGEVEPVVAGCRPTGAWSIYFGGDPCYHFNAEGRLRRAFVSGYLYRTQGETLARLRRERTDEAVVLERTDLRAEELAAFVDAMQERLSSLDHLLANESAVITRREPADSDVKRQLRLAIQMILATREQLAPAIPTRRQ